MRWLTVCLSVFLVCSSLVTVSAEEADPAEPKAIGLVRVGDVDRELVERVRSFAERSLTVPVRLLDSREATGGSLGDEGAAVADLITPDLLCLVALVAPKDASNAYGLLLPEHRMSVVNVVSLKPESDDVERYGRRLEKQTMMGIGMLMGLGRCPNPHCALKNYRNLGELDAIGRGFCPPCSTRYQNAAVKQGAKLIPRVPSFQAP